MSRTKTEHTRSTALSEALEKTDFQQPQHRFMTAALLFMVVVVMCFQSSFAGLRGSDAKPAFSWNVKAAVTSHNSKQKDSEMNQLVEKSLRSQIKAEVLAEVKQEIKDMVTYEVSRLAGTGTCYLHFKKPFGALKR
jgi:hypothetical protein